MLYVFDHWSPYSYQNNRERYENDDDKKEFTLRECLWFCMTSITPEVTLSNLLFNSIKDSAFNVLEFLQGAGEAPKSKELTIEIDI